MNNFQQVGDTLSLTAPSGGVVSGGFYQIGQLLVCAVHDAAQGETFQGKTTGVYSGAPKTTGQSWSEGSLLYWDGTKFTTTASTNLPAGCAVASAQSADTTGTVRLNGVALADAS